MRDRFRNRMSPIMMEVEMYHLKPARSGNWICRYVGKSALRTSSAGNLRFSSLLKPVFAVAIVLLANALSAQNAPPCALRSSTYPCTIGGTLLLPTAPTGNIFGGGGGGGGNGGGGGANTWFLTDPTNPGVAIQGNRGDLLTGTGP